MVPRPVPVLSAVFVMLVAGACAGSAGLTPPPAPSTSAGAQGSPTPAAPTPTPVPVPSPSRAPDPTPTPSLNAGDVDGATGGPELTVEFPGRDLLDVTLEDAGARAWRVVVAGTGDRAQDRLEIVVESGDTGPAIVATEIQAGEPTSTFDLGGFVDDTGVTGGCHRTLGVCIDSSSFRLTDDGTGRIRVRLGMPDAARGPLLITGGTAGWPGEPFILGPWHDTEAFPWGDEG